MPYSLLWLKGKLHNVYQWTYFTADNFLKLILQVSSCRDSSRVSKIKKYAIRRVPANSVYFPWFQKSFGMTIDGFTAPGDVQIRPLSPSQIIGVSSGLSRTYRPKQRIYYSLEQPCITRKDQPLMLYLWEEADSSMDIPSQMMLENKINHALMLKRLLTLIINFPDHKYLLWLQLKQFPDIRNLRGDANPRGK